MSGYWNSEDGICTINGCEQPVEYIHVSKAQTSSYYDTCREHYLREARILAGEYWSHWLPYDPAEVEGMTCEYPTRPTPDEARPCGKSATSQVAGYPDDTIVTTCDNHHRAVMYDNILLSSGWGARGRVEPGWTPTQMDDEVLGQRSLE